VNPPPASSPAADSPVATQAAETSIRRRKIRAPQGDEEALIVPALAEVPGVFAHNQQLLNEESLDHSIHFLDQSLGELRHAARVSLIERATLYTRAYRDVDLPGITPKSGAILAGHQPELFHPGVWLKNFVLSNLGSQLQVAPINLVVDNDVAAHTSVRIPVGAGDQLHFQEIPLDEPGPNVPFEERRIVSAQAVCDFADRLRRSFDPRRWYPHLTSPRLLVDDLWQHVELTKSGQAELPLGELLARARHRLEQDLGLNTLELPLSQVATSAPFLAFAAQLWLDLPRLRTVYNDALAEYRNVNKIRSKNHPVPELAADGDWLEAPFWLWTTENPQRRHLFVRQQRTASGTITLELTDRQGIVEKLTGSESTPTDWYDQTIRLEERGVRIRPRALVTTMYARLIAGDLFIHGIGGAKYDELTDAIIRRFWNIEPPSYLTVTGTVRLPVARPNTTPADLRHDRRALRDLRYRPEVFMDEAPAELRPKLRQLASQRQAMLAERQFDFRRVTPETHRRLDDLRAAMSNLLEGVYAARTGQLARDEELVRQNRLLASREYSFALFPAEELPQQLRQMAGQVGHFGSK
jgi:hypothetical protein